MVNNPMQLMNMFRRAQNPFAFMQQMCGGNQGALNIINALQNKKPEELKQYAFNMAKSRNIDLKQFLNQFGLNI